MTRRSPLETSPGRYWIWRSGTSDLGVALAGRDSAETIRLTIVTTHPIQYHAPWFRALAQQPQIDLRVLYCHNPAEAEQGAGFDVPFSWDVPLLSGYRHSFLANRAARPVSGFNGFNTPEVANLIAGGAADIVLVNGWHYRSAWQAMVACWRSGIPVIARGDSHLHSPRSALVRLAKALPFRAFIPRLQGCAAVGEWSRRYFSHYGAHPDRIFTIPHVVDLERIQAEAARWNGQRQTLQARWSLRPRATTFLFAGKFVEKKHPLDFVTAIARAASGGAAVQGLMVGDGPLRQRSEEEARAANAPVAFTGFLNQSEIAAAYSAADALVLPSDGGETWGLVVNEAMACGRPCMVTDRVGCGPDLVANQGTGEIFPLADTERLAHTMAAWARDPARMELMGSRARQLSTTFAPETAAKATAEACRQLFAAAAKKRSAGAGLNTR